MIRSIDSVSLPEPLGGGIQLYQKEVFMTEQIQSSEEARVTEISPVERVEAVEGSEVSQDQKKNSLKGMLMMALCCGAPLLLILAIPLFGFSLAGVAGTVLPYIVLLVCPLGMYFMMRMMNKK